MSNSRGHATGTGIAGCTSTSHQSSYYGGSHGGFGGYSGFMACDSYEWPVHMGGGGSHTRGGGALRILANATLDTIARLDGSISVSGGDTSHGAGAGGAIAIDARYLRGRASLAANGGRSNSYGAGGGGRIAVHAFNASWSGSHSACGGYGGRSGGAGTILWSVGPDRPTRFRELFIDNCNNAGHELARGHLYDPGRDIYEFERVHITRGGRLSYEPPAHVDGHTVMNVKQLGGDGTGWLVVLDRTDAVVLGPVEDVPSFVPIVTAMAWNDSFARTVSKHTTFYPTAYHLDVASVDVKQQARVVFPSSTVLQGITVKLAGEISGVDWLVLQGGATMSVTNTGKQTNRTAGDWWLRELRLSQSSSLTIDGIQHMDVERRVIVRDSLLHLQNMADALFTVPRFQLDGTSELRFTGLWTLDVRDTLIVQADARIDGLGGGYGSAVNIPGCVGGSDASGGSFGGYGMYYSNSNNQLTEPCGSYTWPYEMGGGGRNRGGNPGGAGGGGILVRVNRTLDSTLRLDGLITSNGATGPSAGGGAGGGILLDIRHMQGSGKLEANGGRGTAGGGGSGGRVAVHAATSNFTGRHESCGGMSWTSSALYGAPGTVLWMVGVYRPMRDPILYVDNCNNAGMDAQLTDPGRIMYEFPRVYITRKGELSVARPNTHSGSRASLTAKQIAGDQTGTMVARPGTAVLMLGPLSDQPELVPVLSSTSWADAFARVSTVQTIYYMSALRLDIVSLDVRADGVGVVASNTVVEGVTVSVAGELSGCDYLTVGAGAVVDFATTGHTTNRTAGALTFKKLHAEWDGRMYVWVGACLWHHA